MTEGYKNLLQEYFQRKKLPLPVYNCNNINTDKVNPVWKASVFILPLSNTEFTGIAATKKAAETIAAKNACEYVFATNNPIPVDREPAPFTQKVKNISDINFDNYKTVLLVDGENCDVDIKRINNDVLVLMFVSKNTTKKLVFKLQQSYNNCFVFVSERTGRDASDHLLTFYAGKLSVLHDSKQYYVLTKDHYGEFLEAFMNNCKFICSLDEFL